MQLPKVYEPQLYESDIYALWEKSGAFKPVKRHGKDNFSIVLPPPNANGDLHVGHSLMFAIQDAVIRYQRMQGNAVIWVPGADHAGFETQAVYEKQLAKEGKSRFDFSREALYNNIWEFVAQNRDNYQQQFRRLGASVDWEQHTYTLDQKVVSRAYQTFKKLWDDGLVYRGERLVNYCTQHRTGFADVEVAYQDATTPLYYLKYGPFELATTRPETKFGDTAVAVHPEDERYKQYINTVVTVEGANGPFEVRVVADEMVDRTFGTGVVKITPAHSFDDWEVAQRHNLPAVRVINHDGTMNEKAGEFKGMTVLEARKAVVAKMEALGLLIRTDNNYKNRVGTCYKCGTVIEPMLMDQWFIDMQPLAKTAIEALTAGKITFYPDSKRKQLITYLENLRDWNISRQIAWGIPIPAYQNVDDADDWIFSDAAVSNEFIEQNGRTYKRDADVFDTWFSSSSWPYATLDYPSDLSKDFYPNSLMETGGEILYPWVSRMIMLGLYVTGDIPFKEVYIHGYVLAEDGAKMSKSVGNVINPIAAIDQYGSDALRLGLLAGRSPAVNRGYDTRRVEEARNFCNKLWNVARFITDKVGDEFSLSADPHPESLADEWMLTKLHHSTRELSQLIGTYRLSEAYELLYHLVWDDVADWYIEASKAKPNPKMLSYTLCTILKLAHPLAPFVTETIWQTLSGETDNLLIVTPWPEIPTGDADKANTFTEIQKLVTEIRNIKAAMHMRRGLIMYHRDEPVLSENAKLIQGLALLDDVVSVKDGQGMHLTEVSYDCWLDVDATSAANLVKEIDASIAEQDATIALCNSRLANESYVQNAPKHIVEQTKDQLAAADAQKAKLLAEKARFTN